MSSRESEWHRLPRLEDRYYQGHAAVLWTLTLQPRVAGWLDDVFHARFREWLVHAGVREGLQCPAYVLMPDHAHLVWLGARPESDQRLGKRFLREFVQREFDRRSLGGGSTGSRSSRTIACCEKRSAPGEPWRQRAGTC